MPNNSKKSNSAVTKESNINWMLTSPDPSPLSYFRYVFPMHRARAFEAYGKVLDSALNQCQGEVVKERLMKKKENFNSEIQKDWDSWLEERKAILASRSIQNTNVIIQENLGTLSTVMLNNLTIIGDNDEVEKDEVEKDKVEKDKVEKDKVEKDKVEKDKVEKDEVEKGEVEKDEIDELIEIPLDHNRKIQTDDICSEESIHFVERIEEPKQTSTSCQSWILSSGTNVGDELAKYAAAIPDSQKCLNLAYWNILDLTEDSLIKFHFSPDDWEEISESFRREVILTESDVPDAVTYFFNELEKITNHDEENIINGIESLTSEQIERNQNVRFTDEDKKTIATIRRAVIAYAENLRELELPVSEAEFDNSFPNMLTKRFLEKHDLKMDVGEIACWASSRRRNEGRSIVLRARIGQKRDFRGTLKNSINNLEAIIGLRSGGLPIASRKKIIEDRIDLSVTMRDVLYNFFKTNSNAPGDDLHRTYVLGIQSWGWVHETYGMDCKTTNVLRLGRLSQNKMPNTMKTLAILESFYILMSDIKSTLRIICDHTNNISLADSRVHRNRKEKNREYDKQGGSFGTLSTSPASKKGKKRADPEV